MTTPLRFAPALRALCVPLRAIAVPLCAIAVASVAHAATPPAKPAPAPSPGEIVAAAPAGDWVAISPADLLVMDLAPDAQGKPRRVVIQLMPAPFSQGWVGNVRTLARAHWWDGLSVYRVQDNYVAQWGDGEGEDKTKAKPLPAGLAVVPQSLYTVRDYTGKWANLPFLIAQGGWRGSGPPPPVPLDKLQDHYAASVGFSRGWPLGFQGGTGGAGFWPLHCYGAVGVARDMSPDTGTGAELYAVIGHAPRQLDRNIALVGRVIEGIQYLSSLPRGTAAMGVYATPAERTAIRQVRLGSELPAGEASFQYLSTESASFARYADARANRRDPFFLVPAGGADICNVPVPVRRVKG